MRGGLSYKRKGKVGVWKPTQVFKDGKLWGEFESQTKACLAVAEAFDLNFSSFRTTKRNKKLGIELRDA